MAKKFEVKLYCESNDLNAMIQVISVSDAHAARFAKRKFFPGQGWEIISVKEVKHEVTTREAFLGRYDQLF